MTNLDTNLEMPRKTMQNSYYGGELRVWVQKKMYKVHLFLIMSTAHAQQLGRVPMPDGLGHRPFFIQAIKTTIYIFKVPGSMGIEGVSQPLIG